MADIEKDSSPKAFDVSKPGQSKANIGSKPMIVGHKSLSKDPMMSGNTNANATNTVGSEASVDKDAAPNTDKTTEETNSTEHLAPSKVKKVIAPLTTEEKGGSSQEIETPVVEEQEIIDGGDVATTEEKKSVDPAVKKMDRDQSLKDMINSKKYFVTIHRASSSVNIKMLIFAILLPVILGAVAFAVLVDAEIIDTDITLPFDFL